MPYSHMKAIALLTCICCAFFCNGCGSKNITISEWQTALDRYAIEHANDDMSFLRESGGPSSTRAFSVLGANTPEKSTDISGVLLGRRAIGERQWLVFLLGRVKKREVEDIRLALRSDDAGATAWVISDDDDDAVDKYRNFKDAQWRAHDPARKSPPLHALEFPSEDDVFGVEIRGEQVIAVEERSGARWTLDVSN